MAKKLIPNESMFYDIPQLLQEPASKDCELCGKRMYAHDWAIVGPEGKVIIACSMNGWIEND